MKKVLVVITTAFVKYGGLTNAYMNYYRFMDKSGLQIDIASFNEPEAELQKEITDNGGNYFRLPDKRKNPLKYLRAFHKLSKGYDVVHVHGNSATMIGELFIAKRNHIQTRLAHCHTSQTMHPIMNKLLKPLFLKSYSTGIAVSKAAGDWLYGTHPYVVLYNAIDTSKYSFKNEIRQEIRKRYNIEEGTLLIGNVGKINRGKNHIFLVEVFCEITKRVPNTMLMIVGDGPIRNEIEQKIKELHLEEKVIFTGMVSDTSKYYSAMDLFLFPSIFEGFGMALLEAQASGLNCLSSTGVTKEADVTGNVVFLELEKNRWIRASLEVLGHELFTDRNDKSAVSIEKIKKDGFDCIISGEKLKRLYQK